jgi:peptidoglycan/LPS O-acetylase OafA/YrhL
LIREIDTSGRVSLLSFYVRRARRILPAATVVLLVVTVCLPLLPPMRWRESALAIAASALYVENWFVARTALNYFANHAPTPVQHYWSLSIEEQFYLVWPLLLLVTAMAVRGRHRRLAVGLVMGLVVAASLAASVLVTASDANRAYYVTHTRVWELGIGGLLALLGSRRLLPPLAAGIAGSLGLAAILLAAFTYSAATPFPGIAALLPTLGTVLIIAAGTQPPWSAGGLLRLAPLTYLGDRSYSLYLWHWPVIVFFIARSSEGMTLRAGLAILALVIVLAHLSYRYVEQPFRTRRAGTAPVRSLAYAAIAIATCVGAAAVTYMLLIDRRPIAPIALGDPDYPGPAVLLAGAIAPSGVAFRPTLEQEVAPTGGMSQMKGCIQSQTEAEPVSCFFGDRAAPVRLALVGDSLAGHWLPALIAIAAERGWALETHLKASCPFAAVTVLLAEQVYDSCTEWRVRVLAELVQDPPDIIVTALSRYAVSPAPGEPSTMEEGLVEIWEPLKAAGTKIIPVATTPSFFGRSPVDCLARGGTMCGAPRDQALPVASPIRSAAEEAGIPLLDLTDGMCGPDYCDAIVGNVLVWHDTVHLTSDYSRLLAPYFAEKAGW